ncbi:MAG: hypothetical protein IPH88_00045 [Bacteroidales bacterium]|nr:hypothetical protein [Bacteroidales bacterium]
MKNFISIIFLAIVLSMPAFSQTNDFYDDAESHDLKMGTLTLAGEIAVAGVADLSVLPLRTVIVKETRFENGRDHFIGAYKYEGYSLYDILNLCVIKKKNEAEFPPIIDLYVEVENEKGEIARISWGEIYYPIHQHEILIASKVTRIVPSKTKELWTLPVESKLVVAHDLLTHRNISMPTKITVKSYTGTFTIKKGMKPMYAPSFAIKGSGLADVSIEVLPSEMLHLTYPAVFYGRGTGIHGTTPFEGILLKELLGKYFPFDTESLTKGIFVTTGKDGYHAVFTYSEIMNRNDQAEVLIVQCKENEDGGLYKLYPAADFFSDRSIKSLESIVFEK